MKEILFLAFSTLLQANPEVVQTYLPNPSSSTLQTQEQQIGGFSAELSQFLPLSDGKPIPVTMIRFRQGPLPEGTLETLDHSRTWDFLTNFFRRSATPSKRMSQIDPSEKKSAPIHFEWVIPPTMDYHKGSLHFYLLIRWATMRYMYFKAIYPTNEGFIAFEILEPHNDSVLGVSKKIIETTRITKEFEAAKSQNPPLRTSHWAELLLLPSDREDTPPESILENQSFLEKNRKSAGLLFLVLSITFFVFIAPKIPR